MTRYPIVEVLWSDAVQIAEDGMWVELDKVRSKPCKSRTVGYLIHETPKAITVAALYNEQGHAGLGITIPAGMIRKVRRL